MSRPNPHSGTGVYYPHCNVRLYCYHAVDAGYKKIYETEEAFRQIWARGYLLSSVMRHKLGERGRRNMFFGTDRAAGDDEYVFLSLCEPHTTSQNGYVFVFDAYELVERQHALVGIDDMTYLYGRLAERLEIDRNDLDTWTPQQLSSFKAQAKYLKDYYRLSGIQALEYLAWIFGAREKSPVHPNLLRWVTRTYDIGSGYINVVRKRAAAVRAAEILVPRMLRLDSLVGVIFRKDWVEIDDFVSYFGPPGEKPKPKMPSYDALNRAVSDRTGTPARCPHCGDWVERPLGELSHGGLWSQIETFPGVRIRPDSDNKYGDSVWVCQSCGSAFHKAMGMGGTRRPEERIGHIDELKKPKGW